MPVPVAAIFVIRNFNEISNISCADVDDDIKIEDKEGGINNNTRLQQIEEYLIVDNKVHGESKFR